MAHIDPGQMLIQLVPFVRTLGLTIDRTTTPGRAVARLPARPEVNNHLGTAHAGAVYTVAETASGTAALSVFGDAVAAGAFIALKESRVAHLKACPGAVTATATLVDDPSALRSNYATSGKVDFPIEVSLMVDDVPTATMTFVWALRAPR